MTGFCSFQDAVGLCWATLWVRNSPLTTLCHRHIHVSLRDSNGKSLFAVSDSELKTGREGAANDDVKFLSQEGEWFLAGVLDGLPDSEAFTLLSFKLLTKCRNSHACSTSLHPSSTHVNTDLIPLARTHNKRVQTPRRR